MKNYRYTVRFTVENTFVNIVVYAATIGNAKALAWMQLSDQDRKIAHFVSIS